MSQINIWCAAGHYRQTICTFSA